MPSGPAVAGMIGTTSAATHQATKAETIIMPSMPMFTTPLRSFMNPHNAPSPMGVATVTISPPFSIITCAR